MEKDSITMKCLRCGKQYRVLDMVMDASGKGMACRQCAGLAPKAAPSAPRSFSMTRAASSMDGRQQFHCLDCKYKFMSSRSKSDSYCPYCGSRSISERAKNSADILLEEARDTRYDR